MKIMNPTPENMRFHAAGHIAAAALIVLEEVDLAKVTRAERLTAGCAAAILKNVLTYVDDPKVSAPPQLRDKLVACIADPCNSLMVMTQLEQWFCDPMNTLLEKGGM
jgi:hypothetical protein